MSQRSHMWNYSNDSLSPRRLSANVPRFHFAQLVTSSETGVSSDIILCQSDFLPSCQVDTRRNDTRRNEQQHDMKHRAPRTAPRNHILQKLCAVPAGRVCSALNPPCPAGPGKIYEPASYLDRISSSNAGSLPSIVRLYRLMPSPVSRTQSLKASPSPYFSKRSRTLGTTIYGQTTSCMAPKRAPTV